MKNNVGVHDSTQTQNKFVGAFAPKSAQKGITIVALIITIIIMLILAAVVINGVIEEDLFNYAKNAKDNTEIASEKQTIKISAIHAISIDKRGDLTPENLENNLKKQITDKQFEVTESGDKIYVEFEENGRIYEVDEDGNAQIYVPYKDETPGELAQDENGHYMIESIEDLVVFSAMVNGGYTDDNINISGNSFSGETVILMRDLDFKNRWSYEDSQTTIYNAYLGIEDEQVPLIDGLTDIEKYKGFIPIGKTINTSVYRTFSGTFNGNNYSIENLSENLDVEGGLFGRVSSATIKNLTVTGNINTTNASAGGIIGENSSTSYLENCINKAKVSSATNAGGIVGKYGSSQGNLVIKNCYNESRIEGGVSAGGIIGECRPIGSATAVIISCYNKGEIIGNSSDSYGGGITGFAMACNFLNCYNAKEASVTSEDCAGGIVGWMHYGGFSIDNCYNLGKVNGKTTGGMVGFIYNDVKCRNCYSMGNMTGTNVGGIIGSGVWNNTSANVFTNCYYLKSETVIKPSGKTITLEDNGITQLNKDVIDIFNRYIETNSDEIDTSEWLKWQVNEKTMPSFIEN